MIPSKALWAGAVASMMTAPLAAQTAAPPPDTSGTLGFSVENDTLNGTDRNYTNGLLLTWRSPSADLPAPLAWLDRQLDFIQGPGRLRWGVAFGQSIFTPTDTQARNPDPNDRPYAGLLYGALSLSRVTDTSLSVLELQAGMIGPSAGGKFVQNSFHAAIGVEPSNGWDYQLNDEPVVALILDRKWRVRLAGDETLGLELLPSATVSVGNLATYVAGGGLLRVGRNLDADFGPPRIRQPSPAAPSSSRRATASAGTSSAARKGARWHATSCSTATPGRRAARRQPAPRRGPAGGRRGDVAGGADFLHPGVADGGILRAARGDAAVRVGEYVGQVLRHGEGSKNGGESSPYILLVRARGHRFDETTSGDVVLVLKRPAGLEHGHEMPDEFDVRRVVRPLAGIEHDLVDQCASRLHHLRLGLGVQCLLQVGDAFRIDFRHIRMDGGRRDGDFGKR